jgi:uncharacterized membrane protein
MPPDDRPPRRGFLSGIRASFLTGLVIVLPAVLTIWVIQTVIDFVDGKVLPLIPARVWPDWLTGLTIPGTGLIIFLIFTLAVGWFAKGLIGRSLIALGENLVARMPVVRSIYNGLKQIAETVFAQSSTSFNRACLVQYPRPGLWAVAFISADTRGEIAARLNGDQRHISVFLPTTPNPTSGFLLFVPEGDVIPLDMSIEEAAKLIISAGLVVPDPDAVSRNPGRNPGRDKR